MIRLEYTVAIVTRNRPEALRLSIPRIMGQSRPPAQLVVVDSSDDHDATLRSVREALNAHPVELEIVRSEPGIARQRNIAIDLVRRPVVCMPDDDSIWFPGVAEAKLDVYERDERRSVAAVCAAESPEPPEGFLGESASRYSMRREDRFRQRIAHARSAFEKRFVPEPARLLGRGFWDGFAQPDWFAPNDIVLVEFMTGFRMSFRTEVIRKVRFEERFTRYSLFEDIDASLGAWRHGAVVGARRAKVFHYKSPERRDDGRRMGAVQLLNKACVVAKHSQPGDPARAAMLRFGRYKTLQYRLGARDQFGRDRLAGARAALAELPALMRASPAGAVDAYHEAMARCLPGAAQ